ncbi:hypothetical protein VTK73DRAFT_469 [Phialemonium thermophilum]|uniref:J domain-containing protein n=1 Tax=Phialemonium thermophilum TaxID=223376 RepID=A0ABR3VV10_9PEZI
MVKVDYTRDYYADLELPPTAEMADIKKQFRKLALKYHPDRNPGRESEVNSKFQTIQSAHEILTNPEQKAKYDAHRVRTTRYPTASGVRGNPWQDVGSQFPAPPKRAPAASRPNAPSAASRYANWVPPSQRTARDNVNDHRRAWERMRPATSAKATQPSASTPNPSPGSRRPKAAEPPPPPPRTESQRKKAEASFGNRKTPFVHTADEPPVPSQNYFTTKQHTNLFAESAAAATAAAREAPKPRPQTDTFDDPLSRQFRETFLDERQSTPYYAQSGEKTNPFDGVDLSRSKTAKESLRSSRRDRDEPGSFDSNRRRRSTSLPGASEKQAARDAARSDPFVDKAKFAFPSRAGEKYTPRATPDSGPTSSNAPFPPPNRPHLSSNGSSGTAAADAPHKGKTGPSVFSFPVDDDTFAPTTPKRFASSSAENINTRFVAEDFAGTDWRFEAGGATRKTASPAKRQAYAKPAPGSGRPSPLKGDVRDAAPASASSDAAQPASPGPTQSRFDPEQWSEKIGPENFVPQPPHRSSASPTRSVRSAKKPKPVRMTAGTAGMVDDDESTSGEEKADARPPTAGADDAPPWETDSPSAMDIDPPLAPEGAAPEPKVPRNIPVEPSRPEWRAGAVNSPKPAAEAAATSMPAKDNARGSEDTDDVLHPNLFADFNNVPPFAPQAGGLGSMADLGLNLPFESKPSPRLPLEREPVKHIPFPSPPKAPQPPQALAIKGLKPSAIAWKKYAEEFRAYMNEFADCSARYADHFFARRRVIEQNRKETGFGWVESRGDAGVREYLRWLEEDKLVRQKWTAICDAHEMRVREFIKCRENMMR